MKAALLKLLSLHLLNPDKGYVLRTDALDCGVGAVPEQVEDDGSNVPVASGVVCLPQVSGGRGHRLRRRHTPSCVNGGHWTPATVCTDHQSLQCWHKEHVDAPSGSATRRARSHETPAKFDLTVVYEPGRLNTVADCLSWWAYPASKGLADIPMHQDEAETAEAKRIIELEQRLELGDAHCFVVMAHRVGSAPEEVGRVGRSSRDLGCPAGGSHQGVFAHLPTALQHVPPQSGSAHGGKARLPRAVPYHGFCPER